MIDAASARSVPARAGIGLRLPHHRFVRDHRPEVAWVEVHPENYLTPALTAELVGFADRYPLSLHAVGMSLGSASGLDPEHLGRLRALERRVRPGLMSDHLSWSVAAAGSGRLALPDLLPLPYTEEALAVVTANVEHAQRVLGRRLLVENLSSYLRFAAATLSEPEFLGALVSATGCGVLLDVNNIHVSAMNQGLDPLPTLDEYLAFIPGEAIGEIHLAGHALRELPGGRTVRIDDHGSRVCPQVWSLYDRAIRSLGARPTLIEWDTALPSFATLQGEAAIAQNILEAHSAREALRA